MLDPSPSIVRNPADLLAVIPYLLGYHPDDCIVVVFVADDYRVQRGLSVSLQAPASFIVDESIAAASRVDASRIFVIGYGPLSARNQVAEVARKLNTAVPVVARLLVNDSRYFCLSDRCPCTPADGAAFDTTSSIMAAEMTLQGRVALPSRRHVDDLVAPDSDAQARTAAVLAAGLRTPLPDPVAVVRSSMDLAASGGRLSDEQVAQLAVALSCTDGRSAAWVATDDQMWQRDLWLDMTRRVPDEYVATPANLVAWNAWRCSEPALAWAALSKAARALPDNTLSTLIGTVLTAPINPATLPWPLPEGSAPEHLFEDLP